jgi:hypothetical protein
MFFSPCVGFSMKDIYDLIVFAIPVLQRQSGLTPGFAWIGDAVDGRIAR